MKITCFVCGLILISSDGPTGAARGADLAFDQTTILLHANGGAQDLAANFTFQNRGSHSVIIAEIKSSCGCTAATLEKKEYAPGETGSIKAVFTVGSFEGFQSKRIEVFSDERTENHYLLTLNVDIPTFFSVTPRFLFWRHDEPRHPKAIEIVGSSNHLAKVVEVSAVAPPIPFQWDIERTEKEPKTRLLIGPTAEAIDVQSELRLLVELESGRQTERRVFLRVLPDAKSVNPLNREASP